MAAVCGAALVRAADTRRLRPPFSRVPLSSRYCWLASLGYGRRHINLSSSSFVGVAGFCVFASCPDCLRIWTGDLGLSLGAEPLGPVHGAYVGCVGRNGRRAEPPHRLVPLFVFLGLLIEMKPAGARHGAFLASRSHSGAACITFPLVRRDCSGVGHFGSKGRR